MRIAVLGLGNMGRAVARRLCARGYEVAVWNRSPGKAEELVKHGAYVAPTVADAARGAEAVLVLVSDDAAVKRVCLGGDGAIAALADDGVLVDMSTVHPDTARELDRNTGAARFIEARVLGRPQALAEGRVMLLLGGAEKEAQRLGHLWSDLSSIHEYTGPAGTAATLKLLSNLILVGSTNLLSEAAVVAQANGIPDAVLQKVFGQSPMVPPATQVRLADILSGDHHGWWTLRLAEKDLSLVLSVASDVGASLPLASTTEDVLKRAVELGYGVLDLGAVADFLRGSRNDP